MNAAHSIDAPVYLMATAQQDDDSIIARALAILTARIKAGPLMDSPRAVREYLTVQAAKHDAREVFGVMFLDGQSNQWATDEQCGDECFEVRMHGNLQ